MPSKRSCVAFALPISLIDGLDEALYDEQFDLLDTLKSVPANFFITSRPLVRLKDVLPNAKFFDIAAQEEDIKLLVAQHIDRNPDLRQVLEGDEQRERVIKKICETSQGMFLHASLMVEAVRYCTNPRHVMEQLDKLPSKLDVLYDEAFKRIEEQPEQRVALTKRLLLWIAFAFIPLTVDDLQYAVASNPKVDWKTAENLIPESLLVSVCCGLITIEGDYKRIVRLVHYTALDAVKRIMPRWETSPDCLLTEACVERLIDCNIPSSSHYGHQPPLLNYALKRGVSMPRSPFVVLPNRMPGRPSQSSSFSQCSKFSPLASTNGEGTTLQHQSTSSGRSALCLAACHNNVEMVELLLKLDGIDVNLQDEDGNTALMLAAGGGRRNAKGRTALHCALNNGADSGHTEAALHLIATPGVDINAADYCGWTPLMVAHNHPPRLHDHLAQHPDIDLLKKDKDGQTPLMHACRWGTSSAVRWYLRLPGVDARDLSGASALAHRARHKSRVAEVEDYLSDFLLLIDAGLGINEQDARGFTALMHAVQGSFLGATQALLQLENVDVNLENREGRTLLMVACDAVVKGSFGARQTLHVLLQHLLLDVNAKGRHGISAMAYADLPSPDSEDLPLPDFRTLPLQIFHHLPSRFECLRQRGLLHKVPEQAIHIRHEEHPSNQPPRTSAAFVVTGKQPPYPPGFRLAGTMQGDYRHTLEGGDAYGLSFPWEPAWILEKHASCARLLLNHPDIDDHGFEFLRHITDRNNESLSLSSDPSSPSPSPEPRSPSPEPHSP
ncbi:hypothetical protein BKA70DRAFT_1516985 [Coprinopsis sp. MPI-PUGE-AT-0042]|nr:hypothetical protein BKA70DRAFT_1516985 [Coprinopsis sp. MPI-PUGE-AT-0042]